MHIAAAIGMLTLMAASRIGYEELPWYATALLALWLWCFGANVGSFMNVVVYRLPIRSSITMPRSRCPRCQHKIRWFDNVPVVSWLVLGGRCRDCRGPISLRYPLVEALVAAVFVLLAFIQPLERGEDPAGLARLLSWQLETTLTLWLQYAYQLLLWCTLLCAALIRFDGKAVPLRLYLPALLIGLLAPLAWPGVRPVPLAVPLPGPGWWIAAGDALAGVMVALALAAFLDRAARRRRVARDAVALPLVLCGLFLGWQAVAALAAVAMLLETLLTVTVLVWRGAARLSFVAALALLTLIYLVFWQPIVEWAPWLGAPANMLTFALAALIVSALSWCQSWLASVRRRRRRLSRREEQSSVRAGELGEAEPQHSAEETEAESMESER